MSLGQRLKELRARTGFSQEMVAERVGVSRQAVTKWESGQTIPTEDNLSALAGLYGVPLAELAEEGTGRVREGEDNPIVRQRHTVMALSAQLGSLYGCTWSLPALLEGKQPAAGHLIPMAGNVVLLILCSMWTVWNLSFEDDLLKRSRNMKLELRYMLVQLVLAAVSLWFELGLIAFSLAVTALLVYIKFINPKYLGRELWWERPKRRK